MTNVNDPDPHDEVLAAAWRLHSDDQPPPALDATILAAAHRAVGSGPREASAQAREATRPQRWWMPLAAAATIGVVVIGILQVAPQAPVDAVLGERAEFSERDARSAGAPTEKSPVASGPTTAVATPPAPAMEQAPASSAKIATAPVPAVPPTSPAADAVPAPASAAPAEQKQSMLADAARVPAARTPEPQPFPADVKAKKLESDSGAREDERKDAQEAARKANVDRGVAGGAPMAPPPPSPPAVAQRAQAAAVPQAASAAIAPAPSVAPVAPMAAPAPRPAPPPAALGKLDSRMRENSVARDEATTSSAPAAASPRQAPSELGATELQRRARDPDAWIAEIRVLRDSGRIAEATAQMREFRRLVPDAETRLPSDLRDWYPPPATR